MSSQEILWISIGLAAFFFVIYRKSQNSVIPPAKLNLKKGDKPSQGERGAIQLAHPTTQAESSLGGNERSLNVIFMYNGHSWDAHEILGVPAGASLDAVEKAYLAIKKQTAIESQEFIEAAYAAIRGRSRIS
jgi:hypothetical protein